MTTVVLGMGCDRGTAIETLEAAVTEALVSVSLTRDAVTALATIDKKNDEPALLALSERYNWPLHFYTAEQLAKVEVPNPSAVVLKYMGTPSVGEAAALLTAKAEVKDLIVEKYKHRGADGKHATVSIVQVKNNQ